MFRFSSFFVTVAFVVQNTFTQNNPPCTIDQQCDLIALVCQPVGVACNIIGPGPLGCCAQPQGVTTVATTVGPVTPAATCQDLLNPLTGTSDCPARANLCNDATYFAVMTQQCPRTCGRCGQAGNQTTGCVDLLNPQTGTSDCPARADLCNNPTYLALMSQQCPRTCGRCNATTTTTNTG